MLPHTLFSCLNLFSSFPRSPQLTPLVTCCLSSLSWLGLSAINYHLGAGNPWLVVSQHLQKFIRQMIC